MGLLLRTKRHTATGKQIQVLVAAVNRHMPATPRCAGVPTVMSSSAVGGLLGVEVVRGRAM